VHSFLFWPALYISKDSPNACGSCKESAAFMLRPRAWWWHLYKLIVAWFIRMHNFGHDTIWPIAVTHTGSPRNHSSLLFHYSHLAHLFYFLSAPSFSYSHLPSFSDLSYCSSVTRKGYVDQRKKEGLHRQWILPKAKGPPWPATPCYPQRRGIKITSQKGSGMWLALPHSWPSSW